MEAFLLMRFWLPFIGILGNTAEKNGQTLTESRACFGPAHRRHDDKAEALVLPAPDLHVIGLQHGAHDAAAAAPATADAAGAAAARAHRVQGVLAALRGTFLLGQRGWLGATVMRGGWRGHLVLCFGGCTRDAPFSYRTWPKTCPATPSSFYPQLHNMQEIKRLK